MGGYRAGVASEPANTPATSSHCQPRTYCPLCLRSHRLCRLPNHSVCVDGRTIGVKRPLLQLSSGAWEWISRERVYNPKIPPNPAFIWSSRVLGEIHPYVLCLENVLFFYLPSSNRVLNCIYVAVQTKKPWDIYENYKSVSR